MGFQPPSLQSTRRDYYLVITFNMLSSKLHDSNSYTIAEDSRLWINLDEQCLLENLRVNTLIHPQYPLLIKRPLAI